MLYNLFYPLSSQAIVFNLIRYITFRSIAAFFTAFIIGVFIAPWFIKKLRVLKFGQEVRDDGPQSHLAKQGTPTMGGLFIILAAIVSILLWTKFNFYVGVVTLSIVLFGAIGFADDFLKVKMKNTKGTPAKLKLLLQFIVSALIITLLFFNPERNREVNQYYAVVKDMNANVIKTFDIDATGIASLIWDGKDDSGKFVTHGVYSLDLMVEDKAGNLVEDQITLFDWPGDYGLVNIQLSENEIVETENITNLIVSEVNTEAETNALPATNITRETWRFNREEAPEFRDWKLTFYAMDLSYVNETEGTVELPRTPDLFFSFYIPFYSKPLWEWPALLGILFFLITLIAFSNATNLSDGLDGLASGMGILLYLPFGIFAYVMGNQFASSYLLFPYLNGVGELAIVIAAMIGGFAAFLWYNVHPAEVFMGDTGSLAMGGAIATCAIILKLEVLLLVAGAMFVLEAVSVVLQVFWFKKFKKRIFKMAPIHHHFELYGWAETQVVTRFWILSALFSLIALSALKIR